jgi:cytochrome b
LKKNEVMVWDRPVRVLHWLLALAVVGAWSTGGLAGRLGEAHELLGYAAGAVVAARLLWSHRGNRYARFGQFVRGPGVVWRYLRAAARGRGPRYIGHNPLGGWMVLLLLGCVATLALSGWLYTTDWLWGYQWLFQLHAVLGWAVVGLVALHVAGVLVTGWRHRENLARAMLTGRKTAPGRDDVT